MSNKESIEKIASDLGVARSSLGKWIKAYQHNGPRSFPGSGYVVEEELRALRRELHRVTQEREFLKKSHGHFFTTPGQRYEFMKSHCPHFCLDLIAKIFGVSLSGYYDYIKRSPRLKSIEKEKLVNQIRVIFDQSHQSYGSPGIHAALKEEGLTGSRPRIARLMRDHGIEAKMYRRFKKTTKRSDQYVYRPNLVQKNLR